jgi:isohexenylglutaconyl-CoA hydratase
MAYETLMVARDGPVLKVSLNRPETRNALSPTMVRELGEVLQDARDDAGVRVVVLMGASGTFCAGGDLKGMEGRGAAGDDGAEMVAASNRRFGALLEMADALPKAVIAVVEGAAMGGGVGLMAVADWVIAERAAKIGTPEVTVGIVPAQITPFLVQRVGYGEARRLATFGLRLGAEEAQRIGLVHEVADGRDELAAKAAAAVSQCLRCAPQAVAETKRLVRASLPERPLAPVLDQAAEMFAAALNGEAREGIRAFVEKRKPAWVENVEKL